jgi:triosephosphate isomerase
MNKKTYIFANWKMCMGLDAAREFAQAFNMLLRENEIADDIPVCLFPSYPHLGGVAYDLNGAAAVGAQDCAAWGEGAYTGEVSASMLEELGCEYVLIGHSERRQYLAESGDLLKRKIVEAQKTGMQAVLCVGEGLDEHEAGDAEAVIERQLREALDQDNVLPGLIVSYEPVWAIGSGKIPSIKSIEQMHKKIRAIVTELGRSPEAVLYGGSVKPGNVKDLLGSAEIDGVLVGGASLKVASFWKICQS